MSRAHSQEGSLPLALLASIVVIGLVTVLFGSTLTSERTARRDRDFTTSFHDADSAVQAALANIREVDDDDSHPVGSVLTGGDSDGNDTVGTGTYTWVAEKGVRSWDVWAEGTVADSTRFVEGELTRKPRFFLAAFGKTLVGFKGGNGAASYNDTAANTGKGAIGSNGVVELIGDSYADMMFLFGTATDCRPDESPGQTCNTIPRETQPDPYVPDTDFMEQALDAGWCTSSISPWRASTAGGVLRADGPGPEGAHCFSSMEFDVDTEVDDSLGPVIAYVSGNVTSANGVKINCPGCAGFDTNVKNDIDPACPDALQIQCMLQSTPPNSANLLIYSVGGLVSLGNHTHMASGVYAPNATCRGNPSNAQGFLYGSMVCNDINNQGGWSFWYDERLEDVGGAAWHIDGVREEPGGFSVAPPTP